MSRNQKTYFWEDYTDEQLLQLRLCDLGLSLEGSFVENCLFQLEAELLEKNLWFRPHVWISKDWFSPYGVSGFAVPFYLFHQRLLKLEQRLMGEAEGDTRHSCLQLLRHEAGHAIDNAFLLRKSKHRQALFGFSCTPYPTHYKPKKKSQHHVKHLKNSYAQAHPDEDWAETFAVWLNKAIKWKKKYKHKKAIKKLKMLDSMMQAIACRHEYVSRRLELEPINKDTQILGDYYAAKQRRFKPSKAGIAL